MSFNDFIDFFAHWDSTYDCVLVCKDGFIFCNTLDLSSAFYSRMASTRTVLLLLSALCPDFYDICHAVDFLLSELSDSESLQYYFDSEFFS